MFKEPNDNQYVNFLRKIPAISLSCFNENLEFRSNKCTWRS